LRHLRGHGQIILGGSARLKLERAVRFVPADQVGVPSPPAPVDLARHLVEHGWRLAGSFQALVCILKKPLGRRLGAVQIVAVHVLEVPAAAGVAGDSHQARVHLGVTAAAQRDEVVELGRPALADRDEK
jgi:hypothetical protein